MTDEIPDIDWSQVRNLVTNLSEMVWSYHAGLKAAGFEPHEALALTLAYQQAFLEQMHR